MKGIQFIKEGINAENEGFAGTLSNIDLTDLIQLCCMSCSDMTIQVNNGAEHGIIYIRAGKIIHATYRKSAGEKAFYRILSWKSGSFEILVGQYVPETSIDQNYQFLLLEAARLADEDTEVNNDAEMIPKDECLRVLIVDDSTMMRRILADLISSDKRISVVGTAENGEKALNKIKELKPDIITLDVNMPVMDGNTTLKHIMIQSPCPVVIVSSLGENSHTKILDFLRLGAVDFIKKPKKKEDMSKHRTALVEKIFTAGMAEINNFKRVKPPVIIKNKESPTIGRRCESLVIIHSGMGGYAELIRLVPLLQAKDNRCFIIFQNMPFEFAEPMSNYLDQRSRFEILPLQNNSFIRGGICYISPDRYIVRYHNDNTSNRAGIGLINIEPQSLFGEDRGSMFHLFLNSVAESFQGRVLVVLLSGADVGDPAGLRNVKKKTGKIVLQQLATCLLPHPLKMVQEEGLVDYEVSLDEIAGCVEHFD